MFSSGNTTPWIWLRANLAMEAAIEAVIIVYFGILCSNCLLESYNTAVDIESSPFSRDIPSNAQNLWWPSVGMMLRSCWII